MTSKKTKKTSKINEEDLKKKFKKMTTSKKIKPTQQPKKLSQLKKSTYIGCDIIVN